MTQNRRTTKTNHRTHKAKPLPVAPPKKQPFLHHIYELRRRLTWVVLSIILFSVVGYQLQDTIISWLLAPAGDQKFIYTTPGGGINFVFQISFYFGFAVSIPLIFYNVFRFIEPLLKKRNSGFIVKATLFSALLAMVGIAFGYFVGIPAAMHFLEKQLAGNSQISALLTLSDYLSFITVYLAGAALMFQLPIIIVFINRIKPLSPKKLLSSERWVVLGAFIMAAIITPTPDLINQAIIAVPIILVYQIGITIVWFQHRFSKESRIQRLREQDTLRQNKREQIEHQPIYVIHDAPEPRNNLQTTQPQQIRVQ